MHQQAAGRKNCTRDSKWCAAAILLRDNKVCASRRGSVK